MLNTWKSSIPCYYLEHGHRRSFGNRHVTYDLGIANQERYAHVFDAFVWFSNYVGQTPISKTQLT